MNQTQTPEPLIHLGYPKCGSTWLQDVVFATPDHGFWAYYPSKRDREQLADDLVAPSAFDFDPASVHGHAVRMEAEKPDPKLVSVISQEGLVGPNFDATRSMGKDIADRLKSVFPKAKILLIIREQKASILSQYFQLVRGGATITLEKILAYDDPIAAPYDSVLFLPFYRYDGIIAYYQSLYGAENVKVVPLELLQRSSDAYLKQVFEFAGAETDPDAVDREVVKLGIPASSVSLGRFLNFFISRFDFNPLRYLLPQALYWRAYVPAIRRIDEWLRPFDKSSRERYRARVDAIVGDYYDASNRRVCELTGLDLSDFGYSCAPAEPSPTERNK